MLSGGGLTTVETAIRFPVRLVESGPAGGAIFAAEIARQCGLDKVLSYDMGGTTAKICLIDESAAADQPRLRGRAHLPLQEGQRPAVAHSGHRDGRDRRRRRLDRAGRPAEADHRRAGQRRRRSGAGLLWARRHRADRDRRRSPARPHRSGRAFPAGAWRSTAPRPRQRCGARSPTRSTWRSSSRRSGSARSSTRTWPTPRASTRSRAARTRAAARSSRLAARHRCMPRAWPKSSGSTGCWCRPMPGSARRSGFCARRSPTRSCARHCSASTSSTPAGRQRALRRDARRGRADRPPRRPATRR